MGTHQTYNENNQLTGQSWQLGSTAYSENYTYDLSDGSLSTMTSAAGKTLAYSYDYLRRLGSVSTGVYTRNYIYRDISTTQTTTQVSRVSYSGLPSNPSYGYTYDALGNILSYTAPDGEVITYTYDNQNQLTRAAGSTTYNYTYDVFGNVLSNNYHSFTYGNNGWGDLLVTVDGQGIAYEGQTISGSTVSGLAISGNPISYYNGTRWTFDWAEGRNLVSASGGGNTITYAYDHNGVRTSKTVNGVVHTYNYASGKLLRETYGNNTLDFFYDASGIPFAVKHNGVPYYYITNLQGDVMQIVDANGTKVAEYDYDPYGTIISATGTMAEVNPLRYRGYYYDTETELYYLQSRYYDPEIGRFINADSYTSTGQGILGNNMFAYCLNNPILLDDHAGTSSTIAGAIIGGLFGIISGVMGGGTPEEILGCAVSGFVTGAVAGFVADVSVATFGVGGVIIGSAIGGGAASMANSAMSQQILNDGEIDYAKVVSDGVFGAMAGSLCTAVGDIGRPVAQSIADGVKHVGAMLCAEETLIVAGTFLKTNLVFDACATAITAFGSWFAGLIYDAHTSED